MTTDEDPTPRPERPDDPAVSAVEEERGGITDASLDAEADTDVDPPDPSLADDGGQVEGHPS